MSWQSSDEALTLRRLYWWSFAIRVSLGMAGWLLMQFTRIELLQDAIYYEEVGAEIAHDWLNGRSSTWLAREGLDPHRPVLIVLVVAIVYTLTLGVRALPLVLVVYGAITSHAPGLTYRLARECGASPAAARFSGWLVAFSPAFVFWSGALYKEGLILLFLNLSVLNLLRLQSQWSGRALGVVALSLLGLGGLRLYIALLVAAAFCLGLILGRSRKPGVSAAIGVALRQAMLLVLFAGIILACSQLSVVQRLLPRSLEEGFQKLQNSRDDLALTNSGYLPYANVSSPERALRFAPVGMAYFLAVPLPWQTGSLRQNLAIPDTAFWLLLMYPLVLLGMWRGLRTNPQACLLLILITFAMIGLYGVMIANIGTAYRLRTQVWLLWAVFAGLGWDLIPRRTFRQVERGVWQER
jgi:hypothetical protein